MQIPIDQITTAAKELDYAEDVGALNLRLEQGRSGLRLKEALAVALRYYRAGVDVVIEGTAKGTVLADCGRCLETYEIPVTVPFRVLLAPSEERQGAGDDDLGLGYFEDDVVQVTPIVHEHLLLAVPTTRVCRPTCRGLCPTCGTNLNEGACECPAPAERPRMSVLHDLLRTRATQG